MDRIEPPKSDENLQGEIPDEDLTEPKPKIYIKHNGVIIT